MTPEEFAAEVNRSSHVPQHDKDARQAAIITAEMQADLQLLTSGWKPFVMLEALADPEFSLYLHPDGSLTLKMAPKPPTS